MNTTEKNTLTVKELFDLRTAIETLVSKISNSRSIIADLLPKVADSATAFRKKFTAWFSAYLIDYLFLRGIVGYLVDINSLDGILKEIIYILFPFVIIFLENRLGEEIAKAKEYAETHLNTVRLKILKAVAVVTLTIPLLVVASIIMASNNITGALIVIFIALGILATFVHAIIIFSKEFNDPTVSLRDHFRYGFHCSGLKKIERKFSRLFHKYLLLTRWEKGTPVEGVFSDRAKILVTILISKDIFPGTDIPDDWYKD